MLVAAISDTHMPRGARRLPEACVERLRTADLILHGGDLSTLEVLEELRALGPPVHAVYGNADEPAVRELLPKELVVEAGGARIGMAHVPGPAAGHEERLVRRFPGCDAVLYGHTHLPEVERHGGSGSSTPARRPNAAVRRRTRCSCWRSKRGRSGPSWSSWRADPAGLGNYPFNGEASL